MSDVFAAKDGGAAGGDDPFADQLIFAQGHDGFEVFTTTATKRLKKAPNLVFLQLVFGQASNDV